MFTPGGGLLVVAGVLTGMLLTLIVGTMMLSPLIAAAERIGQGERGVHIGRRRGRLPGRLSAAINSISAALDASVAEAATDRLTGVNNRQYLLAELFSEVERAHRYDRPLSVAFVDIDLFKAVNDTYGHAAGDVVLVGVAQALAGNLRANDFLGRYGGEEFMLILPETQPDEAGALAEKLRQLVARRTWQVDGETLTVTVSIGIAGGQGRDVRFETLVRDADAAMYSAKSLGRNQTYVFAEPDEDARVPRAPISPDGRARAVEVGQAAREAAQSALVAALTPLPHYRGRPSALIASVTVAMARRLDLPEAEVDRIRIAALLHDVGKVAVPAEILEKPGALTSNEWRSVVQHPRIGEVILEQAGAIRDAVPIILHHHERYSGHGYPHGLRAEEIPLGARIVAIADAYDAMISDRPYKAAMSHPQAVRELQRHAGTQFDPELVGLFLDLYGVVAPEPDASLTLATSFTSALQSGLNTAPARTSASRRRPAHQASDEPRASAG